MSTPRSTSTVTHSISDREGFFQTQGCRTRMCGICLDWTPAGHHGQMTTAPAFPLPLCCAFCLLNVSSLVASSQNRGPSPFIWLWRHRHGTRSAQSQLLKRRLRPSLFWQHVQLSGAHLSANPLRTRVVASPPTRRSRPFPTAPGSRPSPSLLLPPCPHELM